jgi:hypothetical protein
VEYLKTQYSRPGQFLLYINNLPPDINVVSVFVLITDNSSIIIIEPDGNNLIVL